MVRTWRRWRANSVLRINELSDGDAQGVAADRVAGTAKARRARMHDARPERRRCTDQSAAVSAQRRPAGGRCCAATAAFDASSFSSSDVSIRTSLRSQSATNEANRSSPSSVRRACSSAPAGVRVTRHERRSAGSAVTRTRPALSSSRTCRVTWEGWTSCAAAISVGRIPGVAATTCRRLSVLAPFF